MYAYIVTLWWIIDPAVTSSVVLMHSEPGEIDRVEQFAHGLYPQHGVEMVERAPWLDKPTEATHATAQQAHSARNSGRAR